MKKYIGQFKNGLYEGKGYLIDNEGNIYDGNFKNGEKSGEGEYSMNNGNKYIGMFKGDKYHGKGKIIDKDGNIIQEGKFKEGIFLPKKSKDKDKNKKNLNDFNDIDNQLDNDEIDDELIKNDKES